MTPTDGSIISTFKMLDHGPNSECWNLVILSEGYQFGELAQFVIDANAFMNELLATPPFNDLQCGINIYRVHVASNESGADDPATGVFPNTYFDATFGSGGLDRILTIDNGNAQAVATAQVPGWNQIVVLVNSPKSGGSGSLGAPAVSSNAGTFAPQLVHELGHSAFGLADEYPSLVGCGQPGDTNFEFPSTNPEPGSPNITKDTNPATNKWHDLILLSTPMPTMSNPDPTCAICDSRISAVDNLGHPIPNGTVGTFEGAGYFHCGLYRPEFECKMRNDVNADFCAVCQRRIRQTLAPYAMTVTLQTSSLQFKDIPEGLGGVGVTTYRAIIFEVTSCSPGAYGVPITLRIKSGPSAGFGAPINMVTVTLSSSAPVGIGRLWISYTSTTAGSNITGNVTVEAIEAQQEWAINLSANTVARKKTAVTLVLDHSGSMSEPAGDGMTKVQKLRQAASSFVDLMLQGDSLGLVRFDDTAQRIMNVTDVGPTSGGAGTGRDTAKGFLMGPMLDPAGATSIGDGALKGKLALDDAQAVASPHYDVTAIVVLTDGNENTPPMLSTVGSSITANTFAIGFGTADNVSTAALNTLTQNHNGYLLVTGNLTPDQSNRLTKYFLQILAGITNANVIVDPQSDLTYGIQHRIPFSVTEADYGMDVIVLSPAPRYINFYLETPEGQIINPARAVAEATIDFVVTKEVSYYRLSLPALPGPASGSHEGIWHAVLALAQNDLELKEGADFVGQVKGQALPYDLVVHTYSSLVFKMNVQQKSLEPGAEVKVRASLTEYDVPVERRTNVWAEITDPNGSSTTLALNEEEAGQFAANFIAGLPGVYQVRARAIGTTFNATSFQREGTLTAATFVGGDRSLDLSSIVNNLEICCKRFGRLLILLLAITLIVGFIAAIALVIAAGGR